LPDTVPWSCLHLGATATENACIRDERGRLLNYGIGASPLEAHCGHNSEESLIVPQIQRKEAISFQTEPRR